MNWKIQEPYLEITSKCNLHCRHCYNSSSSENTAHLSRETISTCLEYFSNNNVLDLTISGGEPLLHPDIVNILQDAHERGFRTLLATNGTLLSICGSYGMAGAAAIPLAQVMIKLTPSS